jgi:predicted ATPase
VAQAVEALRELLDAARKTTFLATSRRALEMRAEAVIEISPLSAVESERLFVERAQAAQSDFALTDENAADVAELCRRLEGVPLAIELAASRSVGMTPRQMLARLRERFRLLQTRAPDLPPRQRALHATIDWSYCLLAPEEREVFHQLGVFAGGFTMEDAEAVCEAFDVFESVMTLRRHSFLRAKTDARTQEARFVMFESLRDYAGERLAETDDGGHAVRQRHAEHCRDYARKQLRLFRTPSEAEARRQLEASDANLRAALEWARQAGAAALYAELALMVGIALQRRGFHREAAARLQTGLEALLAAPPTRADAPETLRAELLRERAGLHLDLRESAAARQRAQEALAAFAQSGDARGQAQAENLLGQAAVMESAFAEAREHYTRALAHHEQAGDAVEAAIIHNNLGILEYTDPAGDRGRSQQQLEEALRLRRAHDDRRGMAETLNNLGELSHYRQDWAAARRHYTESLRLRQPLGDPYGVAIVLSNLGEVAEAQGQLERACRFYAAAEQLFDEAQSPHAAYSGGLLAKAAARQGLSEAELQQAIRGVSLDELIAWAAERGEERTE